MSIYEGLITGLGLGVRIDDEKWKIKREAVINCCSFAKLKQCESSKCSRNSC